MGTGRGKMDREKDGEAKFERRMCEMKLSGIGSGDRSVRTLYISFSLSTVTALEQALIFISVDYRNSLRTSFCSSSFLSSTYNPHCHP